MMILPLGSIAHVRDEAALLTGHEVVLRSILVIAHDRLGFACAVPLVLLD